MSSVRRKVIAFGVLCILALFLLLMLFRFFMEKMEQGEENETAVQTVSEESASNSAADEPKVLYFLMGHNMAGCGMRFTTELTQAGFLSRKLDLTEAGEVPEDVSLLLICGPLTDIGEEEENALEAYAGAGGDLMVFLDGDAMVLPNLEKLLAGYGVAVVNGVLLDPKEGYFEEYETLLLCDLYYSEMTKRVAAMKKKYPMPMSRAFLIDDGAGLRTEPILQTSGEAYIFSFAEESGSNEASFKEEETGKYLTAAWIRRKEKKGNSDLVVFGSAQVLIAADQMDPEAPWGDAVELLTEVVMNLTK